MPIYILSAYDVRARRMYTQHAYIYYLHIASVGHKDEFRD